MPEQYVLRVNLGPQIIDQAGGYVRVYTQRIGEVVERWDTEFQTGKMRVGEEFHFEYGPVALTAPMKDGLLGELHQIPGVASRIDLIE